jgi:hypothetical protein
MAGAKGDEDLHPKGILVEHPSLYHGGAMSRFWDRLTHAEDLKAHLSDDGEGRAFSYVSDPSGHKSAGELWKSVQQKDPMDLSYGANSVVAFPVASHEANQVAAHPQPPTSYMRQPRPMHFPTGAADYLVGKPTEVHDLVHEIRHGQPKA